jgi:hypothetical protein
MVTFKQQVVQKALDKYIEDQERGLEVAQKALAMHQKMHRAEVQEAQALGRPVSEIEYIDEESRTLSDELLDGQREIEATRQRIEEARTARLSGPRESEDFLNDHKGDNWADQTALDDFGVAPPEDSGLGPIEDYEPGQGPSTPSSEPPTVDAGGEPPMADPGTGTHTPTLRKGETTPGSGPSTLKPGEGQPTPGPSEPPTAGPSPGPPSVPPGATEGPGGTEPARGPGPLSKLGGWLADSAPAKVMQAGWEWVKVTVGGAISTVGGVIATALTILALLTGLGGLAWALWPSGSSSEPPPRPPEPPGVQAPIPASPETAPPNPFEPPQAPEGVPENPFDGPETAPPNPFEPPQAPEGVPENPFEPPEQQGGDHGGTEPEPSPEGNMPPEQPHMPGEHSN